ncbi:hypothetical protein DL764_002800 [Monosporascus ibericus]|uniref:Nop14-like family protein n=1 Tax=Monosporascus ibericus TaxID=155417 RepID=A0A4Q4TMB3_9PEZI|nr:hypothetical protein DL764_002800 [Monosporascus ibericus]
MAGSQLKRLKAALREQGVIGPQQSKKQKKQNAQNGQVKGNKRLQKAEALDNIRTQFNPFDLKHNVRGPKFEVTSNRPPTGNAAKGINGRPSEAKALGEERRRQTLLVEMNRRNKVGGILDRRFGESDPTMAPEDKMLERFAREKQRSHKRSIFDLEDDEPSEGLTHMGQSLSLDGPALVDDYDEEDALSGSGDDASDDGRPALKRMRPHDAEDSELDPADQQPERKKTKQEVMKEVIAKSKFYKYERQQAKDADEDLREQLDQEFRDLHPLLFSSRKPEAATGAPEAPTAAAQREKLEQQYDIRLRQLALDRRAQPTNRTKTEEEKAEEEANRLKELELKKIRRMEGQEESESEDEGEGDGNQRAEPANGEILFIENEEDDNFGLGSGIKTRPTAAELGFDDEDDFLIEDDLIADGSDLEPIESDDVSGEDDESDAGEEDDDEFTKGLLNEEETSNPVFSQKLKGSTQAMDPQNDADGLPYTFPCPGSLEEVIQITKNVPFEKIPTVVQRIRALYHPKLDSSNKEKLGNFARSLSLIRHTHSLAKTYAIEIANAFRTEIEEFRQSRRSSPNLGDLVTLTAIGTIFPTSDHFHQVVTPAMLLMAQYLGQKVPKEIPDYAKGAYLSTLALQHQKVAKRYVPEVMNFSLNTLCALAPVKAKERPGSFPVHEPAPGMRISNAKSLGIRRLRPSDCVKDGLFGEEASSAKLAIMGTTIEILDAASETWTGKSSFLETFEPVQKAVTHLRSKGCRAELPSALNERIGKLHIKLERMLRVAQMSRRNLELHHHRPLAIKMAIPKFEDTFDPNRHYDPDRDRAELAKLRAEHKKERKGALRELRKDARFVAREKLKAKKEKDAAYEKKYKRLIAEIQSEEGREANAYEREKQLRKRAAKSGR